jgi:acetyl esterase/lipase
MMELERIENIPYGLLTDRAHLLDLLKPRAAKTPLPVVIHFHGGGWRMFGKYLTDCEFSAEAGFCTISANYRYMQEELFPAQLEDARAVVAWVRTHADQYGLDENRIGVWGISAGGHIAALLGVRGLEHHIKAAASICAPTDLTNGADWALEYADQGFAELLGAHAATRPDLAARASPVHQISSPAPFLILHGERDDVVPIAQARALHQSLQRAGGSSHLEIFEDGDHYINETHRQQMQTALLEFFQNHL